MKRELHLNLFIHGRGHHEASWRHPASSPLALTDIDYYRDLAQRAEAALCGDTWVVDGNHPEVRDLIWRRADTIVWLDYQLALIMWRLTLRTFRRVATREVLWNGNRERDLSAHFFSRDSIFLWALRTYGLRRREYPVLLASSEYAHLRTVRLRSPRATNAWLASLSGPQENPHISPQC